MPALFLELFSEEIPARMQTRAADDLARLVADALAPLAPAAMRAYSGPRRLAIGTTVAAGVAERRNIERGPRKTAPEQALAGFLRKHGAIREQLREDGDFLVLDRTQPGIDAAALIARELPAVLRRFPWPKSMRWGGTSHFTWVRPLRRITCLLDGVVVPFDLRDGDDDGHGLISANVTEGHRFLAPGTVAVSSVEDWMAKLAERRVVVDAAERRSRIETQIRALANSAQLTLVEDPGLIDEVAGLVEWPVALMGRIDDAYMDLPPEVMQVSMRVNQRYFALRHADGSAAPRFIFVSNIEATDAGRASVAGNERVLRARFSDARHFWDLDRQNTLESRVAALDGVTFHAKLGSQGDRVRRLEKRAAFIAPMVGADPTLAARAARLAKADLTTGVVGEFPELQGVMGRYYALHDGEDAAVADAVRDHYAPKGLADAPAATPVSIAVALADKIDQLVGFFSVDEKPSGSGDPFALRRAALGILRTLLTGKIHLNIMAAIADSAASFAHAKPEIADDVFAFMLERLRVQLRNEGKRHDIFEAVFHRAPDNDLVRAVERFDEVSATLATDDGRNLLAAYRRAANILRIEDRKDGPHVGEITTRLLELPEERSVAATLDTIAPSVAQATSAARSGEAMSTLATLRAPLDAFFDKVTVNDTRPDYRRNRLRLLARVRDLMDTVADFSKIEGT